MNAKQVIDKQQWLYKQLEKFKDDLKKEITDNVKEQNKRDREEFAKKLNKVVEGLQRFDGSPFNEPRVFVRNVLREAGL